MSILIAIIFCVGWSLGTGFITQALFANGMSVEDCCLIAYLSGAFTVFVGALIMRYRR